MLQSNLSLGHQIISYSFEDTNIKDNYLLQILEVLELRTGRLKILKLAKKHGYLGRVDRELRTLRRIRNKPHSLIVRWFGVMELQVCSIISDFLYVEG